MGKHSNKEAYYERLKTLAEVKSPLNENKGNSFSTLIDYKRAADGIAYGIIKENHNYYLKKAGLKQNPDTSDFTYIGGLGNITEYQYKSLAEADKQRNMIFQSINEAVKLKPNINGGKKKLLTETVEEGAEEEINASTDKLDDLDAATNAVDSAPVEPAAGMGGEELPSPDVATNPDLGGEEEVSSEEEIVDDKNEPESNIDDSEEEESLVKTDIQKNLGKLTNKIRKTELTEPDVKSYVNTFLSAFKDKFPKLDIEIRKEMADKILKTVPDEEVNSINIEDKKEEVEEGECLECDKNNFPKYAESRGYDKDSVEECGDDEMANLVSGYANNSEDDIDDNNLKVVALFVTPEILNSLKNDYGHEELATKLEPIANEMNECTPEKKKEMINEAWGGGLAGVGQAAWSGIKNVASNVQKAYQAGSEKQNYNQGVKTVNKNLDLIQQKAAELVNIINAANVGAAKTGQQPINVASVLQTMVNQLKRGGQADLSKYKMQTAENVEGVDSVQSQPGFAAPYQSLGVIRESEGKNKPFVKPAPKGKNMIKEIEKPGISLANKKFDGNKIVAKQEEVSEDVNKFTKGISGANKKFDGNKVVAKGTSVEECNKTPKSKKPIEEDEKPSAGLSKEKKSEVVKAAKKGEDIGKKGKGFKDVAAKATKEYGSKEKGEKVAATAMWKNIKRESVETDKETINEGEVKLRNYVRNYLEKKKSGKSDLNENKKSEKLIKLDGIIEEQLKIYESSLKKKVDEGILANIGSGLGFDKGIQSKIKSDLPKLSPNDAVGIDKLFFTAFPMTRISGAIKQRLGKLATPDKIKILNGVANDPDGVGSLALSNEGGIVYKPTSKTQFSGGNTHVFGSGV